jgi:uncharacterized protein (DUF58 family)
MLPKELFDKVRRIEITTNRLVTDIFAGQYHSVFKGRGMEFDEVREYQPGDDVRTIDWNVTARTGIPYIKKFVEERELTVMILIDASLSGYFATVKQLKNRLAAEIAAVLSFAAIRNNDKIGVAFFTDTVEKFIPPRKGKSHVLRVIREVLSYQGRGSGTDIGSALEFLSKVTTRKAVCFLISDFFEPEQGSEGQPRFAQALSVANRRHDVVAVTLNDPLERDLPDCGLVELRDAETGKMMTVDTGDPSLRREYSRMAARRLDGRARFFRSMNVDHVDIWTDRPFSDELVRFFAMRKRKMR